ncbi:MAG: SRPBCC family protein [bacterium]
MEHTFEIATDVSKWPEFLESHKEMKIIGQAGEKMLIEWGKPIKLRTSIIIERENKRMVTEQVEGLVKGLKAEYIFKEKQGKTEFSLMHSFDAKIPIIGRLIEFFLLVFLKKMAYNTLNRIKERVEK